MYNANDANEGKEKDNFYNSRIIFLRWRLRWKLRCGNGVRAAHVRALLLSSFPTRHYSCAIGAPAPIYGMTPNRLFLKSTTTTRSQK
jgi:hypothetical protein